MIKATYGHGTHNDFVLVFDENDQVQFTKEQIKRICDRTTGIGSDGFIKIIKKDGSWFMDYLNADGSVAEMCGNGIRVMARYLTANGHQPSGIYAINMGNPHAVVFVDEMDQIGDLKAAPIVEPEDEYPEGVNVEFVKFLENGELQMRVHERGVGETQSCGTGTCAVALAATIKKRKSLPIKWVINTPGGRLSVDIDGHSNATLSGPAELVKEVDLDQYL